MPLSMLFLFILSSFEWSGATTFLIRSLPEVTAEAPLIVRGKTGDSFGDWVQLRNGQEKIYTFTELDVTEVLKGDVSPGVMTVREIGGRVGEVGLQIPGTARFRSGEEVVLLLGERNEDRYTSHSVRGLMLGKYTIQRDSNGTEFLVGGVLGELGGGSHHPVAGDPRKMKKRWTIEEFRTLLRTGSTPGPGKNAPTLVVEDDPKANLPSDKSPSKNPRFSKPSEIKEETPLEESPSGMGSHLAMILLGLAAIGGVVVGIRYFSKRG